MDLDDTPEQAAHRTKVRAWLEQHKGEAPVLTGPGALTDEAEIVSARRAWQGKLAEAGLAGVTWPKEYGGQGLGPIEQVVCNQEIAKAGVPGILDAIGVGMLGPTIIAHGSEEQKGRYLGPMLHGDEVWCQLFSEPAAGSDLAAVQTRARQDEDGSWRLSGQKVWTTNAQFASYGLLLARTDPEQHKHKGLTMFVIPMDAPGVTVRGLRQISGEAEFNEVFLDDVKLDEDAVVGGVGNGWGTALTTLMFERVTIGLGGEGLGYNSVRFAKGIASDEHGRRDLEVRKQLGEIASELLAVRFTGYRTLTALQKGQIPGPEAGLAKVTIVNGAIKAGDLIADVLGPDALEEEQRVGLHDLVPARPEVGRRHRRDPAQHDRRARARVAPGAAPGQGNPVLGAALQGRSGGMNLALSDEQVFLREAARGALSRYKTLEAAREALDGDSKRAAGPVADRLRGRLAGAVDRRGSRRRRAGRVRRDAGARRVRARAGAGGAARAPAGDGDPRTTRRRPRHCWSRWQAASGGRPTCRRCRRTTWWTGGVWTRRTAARARRAPQAKGDGKGGGARQRHVRVRAGCTGRGSAGRRGAAGGQARRRRDRGVRERRVGRGGAPLRRDPLARSRDAHGRARDACSTRRRRRLPGAWHLAQALIAAESLGSVETALEMSVAYAKERHTFGRAIGSYQAVKHALTEVLRQLENGRSLLYYAGWSRQGAPAEFPLAASAARSVAGRALDHGARTMISVHGGIGATWEHDAPLYFRRAQLSRRLLGGTGAATDRVAGELIAQADAA